jgi:hypothetical protein
MLKHALKESRIAAEACSSSPFVVAVAGRTHGLQRIVH